MKSKDVIQQKYKNVTCPKCNSNKNKKDGRRKTFSLQSPYHASSRTKSKIIHNVVIADERGFNYPIERLHNTIRERTKTLRGFHGCLESAQAIMKGLEINYNFNRKHMSLGKKDTSRSGYTSIRIRS